MRKIKLFLCVALFGAIGYGAFSAYDYYTMSEEEKFTLANVEALTTNEPSGGGSSFIGDGYAYGTCSSSIMFRLNCSVSCSICGRIYEATPIVRNAVGTATSGRCTCGNTYFNSRY